MEGLSKKEKGLMGRDNRLLIAGVGCIRGLNGNGKNTIVNKYIITKIIQITFLN